MSADHSRARRAFLADQHAAIAAQHRDAIERLAHTTGHLDGRHPAVRVIVSRLRELAEAGQLGLCEHLDPAAPRRAHWIAARPDRLLCDLCLVTVGGAFAQQRSLGCDVCGVGMRPAELEGIRIAVASTMVFGLLCPTCVVSTAAEAPGGAS